MIKKTRDRQGQDGYLIDASARIKNPLAFNGKKQLRRTRFITLKDCPTKTRAKMIASQWENELIQLANSSLKSTPTFSDYVALYLNTHKSCYSVERLNKDLGSISVNSNFSVLFYDWIESIKFERKKRWRNVNGIMRLIKTSQKISESMLQSYRRYAKAILSNACRPEAGILRISENPLKGMHVGRSIARWRIIRDSEVRKITEVVGNDYPWLLPALEFTKCNPIRPQDQFSLRQTTHFNRFNMSLRYIPKKTEGRTRNKIVATPFIFDHLVSYFKDLPAPEVCDYIFQRPGIKSLGQDEGRLYQIGSIKKSWKSILRKADIQDIRWYDFRHHAVKFLRSKGFPNWLIMRSAGWATDDMLEHYDPHDEEYAQRYANELMEKSGFKEKKEVFNKVCEY